MKPFCWGLVAGYILGVFVPISRGGPRVGGNLRGNAGGFAGGNPGVPEGPGFYH